MNQAVQMECSNKVDTVMDLDISQVCRSMQEAVSGIPDEMGRLIREQVSQTGKLLRPRFFLATYRMFCAPGVPDGGLPDDAYRLAASLELLHCATLMHDDILDEASMRRGKKTIFALQGAKRAVLAGDLLLTCALSLSADLLPPQEYRTLSRGLAGICKGEVLQLTRQNLELPSMRLYYRQISAKTALLFSLSFRSGAQAGGALQKDAEKLQRAGFQVGLAFQIIDDIFDIKPEDFKAAKTASRDIPAGLVTAPVLCALLEGSTTTEGEGAKKKLRLLLGKVLGTKSPRERQINLVKDLVEELGGFSRARWLADRHVFRCKTVLDCFGESKGKTQLLGILDGLNKRSS